MNLALPLPLVNRRALNPPRTLAASRRAGVQSASTISDAFFPPADVGFMATPFSAPLHVNHRASSARLHMPQQESNNAAAPR